MSTIQLLPTKKRGVKFWLIAILLALLAIVLLAFAFAWSYLNLGFLKSNVEARVAKKFGMPAHISSMKSGIFGGVDVGGVSIDARDKGAPLSIESAVVEWDLKSLLSENRLRAISLNRPNIELRYDAKTGLNHQLKLGPSPDEKIRIDRYEIRNGTLGLSFTGDRSVTLKNLTASFTDFETRAPSPFAMRGELNPLAPITIDGSTGPGANDFILSVHGNAVLERDATLLREFVPGLKGGVRFEFSARGADANSPSDPLSFSAAFKLKDFTLPLGPSDALVLPSDNFDIHLAAAQTANTTELRELIINSERLGKFSAKGALETKNQEPRTTNLRIDDVIWHANLESLDSAFSPSLLNGTMTLRGPASLTGASLSMPLAGSPALLSIKGLVSGRGLRWSLPDLGELPAADVDLQMDWPALKHGTLKLADTGSIELAIDDVTNMPGRVTTALRIEKLNFDLGPFIDSAFGRRMLGASPFAVAGSLGGSKLEWIWSTDAPNSASLAIGKLAARDVAIARWPLALPAPGWKFSGPLKPEFKFQKDNMNAASLSAELKGRIDSPLGEKQDPREIIFNSTLRWVRGPKGWSPGESSIDHLKIPLDAVDRAFALLADTGFELSGDALSDGMKFDPQFGAASGSMKLAAGVNFTISNKQRTALAGLLHSSGHSTEASLIKWLGIVSGVSIKDFNADLSFLSDSTEFVLTGHTQPATISLVFQLVNATDISPIPQLQALSFEIKTRPQPGGGFTHQGWLAWEGGKLSCDATQSKEGRWKFKATFAGKTEVAIEGAYNDATNQSGPLKISVPRLALVAPENSEGDWGGAITKLVLELSPMTFGRDELPPYEARLTAEFDDATFPVRGQQFEKLRGKFTVRAASGEHGVSIDAQSELFAYASLLGGALRIAPRPGEKSTALKLAFSVPKFDAQPVRLDKFNFDLPNFLTLSGEGILNRDMRGELVGADLAQVLLHAPDLKRIGDGFVKQPPALSGQATYNGALLWENSGRYNIEGTLKLARVAFDAKNLDGEFKLSLPEKKEEPPNLWRDLLKLLREK